MKQILFIGAHEKTDLIFYIAKLLSVDHKVLIADVTIHQDYRFTYPKVSESAEINQHDNFYIAENLDSYSKLEQILTSDEYNVILIDINNPEALRNWSSCDEYFLVTSHDNAVLQKNIELIDSFFQDKSKSDFIPFSKIVIEATSFTDQYINSMFDSHPIDWKDTHTFYPDERDLTSKYMNQHLATTHIKKVSGELKQVIQSVVGKILNQSNKETKTLWKQAERS